MKRIFLANLFGFFLLNLLTFCGFGQNAQNILNRMIEAAGGREALEEVKDTKLTGTIEIIQLGASGTFTFCHKEPDMLRQDIGLENTLMVMTSASDGKTAWMSDIRAGGHEDMPDAAAEEFNYQALNFGFSWMLEPGKYGLSYTDRGTEQIGGKDYLVLVQTAPGGLSTDFYVDPETYLVYKSKTMITDRLQGFQFEQETLMEDYRDVGGIMFAFMILVYQDGREFCSVTVETLEFNSGLEDSLFKRQNGGRPL